MERMELDQVKEMFGCMADAVIGKEALLTEIDEKIGDGDHGIGMARGFLAVKEQLPKMEAVSVNALFKEVGMTLLDAMGGASGVIFGTMFISGCGAVPLTDTLSLKELAPMMKRSLDNIQKRGGDRRGDKTMIDSYGPAVEALLAAEKRGDTLSAALKAAKTIKAVWHNEGGPCWTFETDIPHETFTIMEDGAPWCIGIVFSMADLGVTV